MFKTIRMNRRRAMRLRQAFPVGRWTAMDLRNTDFGMEFLDRMNQNMNGPTFRVNQRTKGDEKRDHGVDTMIPAYDMLKNEAVVKTTEKMAVCDGGEHWSTHPVQIIQLNTRHPGTVVKCKYCMQQFQHVDDPKLADPIEKLWAFDSTVAISNKKNMPVHAYLLSQTDLE